MIIRGGMHEASPVWCQLPGHFAHHMHGHHVGAPLRIATIIPPPSWLTSWGCIEWGFKGEL
jgi:hypothetical protein